MARKVTEILIDDLDGSEIPANTGSTVSFAYRGAHYEIDLSDANAAKLDSALSEFISSARKVAVAPKASRKSPSARTASQDLSAVRTWLREQGHSVSERGRIPAVLLEEYANANH